MTTLRKAVIPAAGLGLRMQELSQGAPKEMLPAAGKPMIQHVCEEALAAGLTEICVVIREGKEIIREYLESAAAENFERPRHSQIAACRLVFVYQQRPLGLGDAILQAREFVGQESFVLMIPDQLLLAKTPAALQLASDWKPGPHIRSSLLRLSKTDVPFFGGARGVEFVEGDGQIMIQRLQTETETQSKYRDYSYEVRGFGRTIYPPQIFDYLGPQFVNPDTGEVDLWLTFQACASELSNYGVFLEGEPMDLGTPAGYLRYLPRFNPSNN